MKKLLFLLMFLVLVSSVNAVVLVDFYGEGCPHCAKLDVFLEELEEKYEDLEVKKFETYFNQENRELFEKVSSAYGEEIQGVPSVFIDNEVISGFNEKIGEKIEEKVKECLEKECEDPLDKVEDTNGFKKIGVLAVISAAFVDAINPCAFAVLIILLSTVLVGGDRKRALFSGLAFSLAIFISYFLMGLGLYSVISVTGISSVFYWIVGILAILIGLFNLKDYLWYGKWFKMEVPDSWRPKMKSIIRGVTSIPGAFIIGIIISLFLLPCTSGPYIVILGLLGKIATRNYAVLMLLLYNLVFILPMLIITFGVSYGLMKTEKIEEWRVRKLRKLHLVAGVIILLLGIGILISVIFGWV
jgi:cytochrome c biogenesis protein CcdA/glutaredoxin